MDLRKAGRRLILVLLLAAVCLVLSGCRTRIAPEEAGSRNADGESTVSGKYTPASEENRQTEEAADAQDVDGAVSEKTVEDPESDRREFDETAPVEIAAGLDRLLHAEGEGNGTPGLFFPYSLEGSDPWEQLEKLFDEYDEEDPGQKRS